MSKYLVLTSTDVSYHDTDREAASAVLPPWDCRLTILMLNAMAPGDELDVTGDASIIKLSGVNHDRS